MVIAFLINNAFTHRSRTNYCVKLLEVVEQIGQPLPFDKYFDLKILKLRSKKPEVVNAVVRVMARCRYHVENRARMEPTHAV